MLKINLEEIIDFDDFINEEFDLDKINELSNFCTIKNKNHIYGGLYSKNSHDLYNQAFNLTKSKKEIFKSKSEANFFISSFVFDTNKFNEIMNRYDLEISKLESILKQLQKSKKERTECVIKSKKLETLFKHFGKIKIEVIINKLYELLYYYKLEKNAEKSPKTYKCH